MKILYLGSDRSDAARVTSALEAALQDASVAWAQTPDRALEWLRPNPDAAALVIHVYAQTCASFIGQVRAEGRDTPVVVIAESPRIDVAIPILNAGADGYVAAGSSLEAELGPTVAMAIQRARARRDLRASAARDARIALDLQARLLQLERTLQKADERRASEVAALADQLARRHTEFTAALAQSTQLREALAGRLVTATAALEESQRARVADAEAAAERLCRREADLAALDAAYREADERHAAEMTAAAARLAQFQARQEAARKEHAVTGRRLLHVVASYRRRHLDHVARLEIRMAAERFEAIRHRRAAVDEIRRLRMDREAELDRIRLEHEQLRGSFDGLQSAFQTLEQTAGAHVSECARLEGVLADRERQLDAEGERHRAAEHEAHSAITQLRADLDASRARAERLQREAALAADLQQELDASRKERRREFERAPYGLCRCTADGVITDANHSFLTLFGRRRVDHVLKKDFAAAVSNCAGDLGWLLDRARRTRRTETVETGWTPADGRRLVVRLRAVAVSTGAIEIVAEDITEVRALEERLRRAQQMEAVGRLASEVAGRCEVLLGDVIRGANDCVAAFAEHDGLRSRGERLVTDAVQIAAYVRQLAAYGDSQARAVEPVSAQRILHDLAPVLRRLAGERIELTLSKSSGSFLVDAGAERLERILVNVVGYARQRMSAGGMRIDLATTAVGRRFVARHPHVRPGDHVLITVTELPHAGAAVAVDLNAQWRDQAGVDLGALVELIGTCGGHLWMEAQPAGNIVIKIHLPKRAAAEGTRADRGGRLTRWFRSTPPAALRA